MKKQLLYSVGQSKVISVLFFLFGLTAVLYLIAILPLYYLTGASEFKHPDKEYLPLFYSWIKTIGVLINIWLTAFLFWIALFIITLILKSSRQHRKIIWFSAISLLTAAYVSFLSEIGAGWWKEYSFMIHDIQISYMTLKEIATK